MPIRISEILPVHLLLLTQGLLQGLGSEHTLVARFLDHWSELLGHSSSTSALACRADDEAARKRLEAEERNRRLSEAQLEKLAAVVKPTLHSAANGSSGRRLLETITAQLESQKRRRGRSRSGRRRRSSSSSRSRGR